MSKLKDATFTDQEPSEAFEPDPVYDEEKEAAMIEDKAQAELFTALAKAQGELQDAHKDKQGYGYNYADLSQVLSIARPVLSKYGLSVVQLLGGAGDTVTITTVLAHASGQTIQTTSSMEVVAGKGMSHAQAVGATCTYLRRYALSAMVGITQSDTDAAPAQTEKPATRKPKVAPDPDVIRSLLACEDLDTLREMWGKLAPAQHKLYAGIKEQRKNELEVAKADKEEKLL